MYAVSKQYLEAMHEPVQRHKLTGTIGEIAFDESDILSGSFSISGQCSDTSNVQIGQVLEELCKNKSHKTDVDNSKIYCKTIYTAVLYSRRI